MPTNLDLIREGKVVEYEPGKTAYIDKKKKTLHLSNGRVMDVSDNPDYFPKDERQKRRSKQKEYVEKDIKGTGGEFYHQFMSQGIGGSLSDIKDRIFESGEDYADRTAANAQASERISEESPWTSAAATGASIGADIALTHGMSAATAAPLLTAAHAGSKIYDDPLAVAGEAGVAMAGGKLIDVGGKWLSDAAKRRGQIREFPQKQADVRNSNMLGQQLTDEANALQQQQFNAQKASVKNRNRDLLAHHESDVQSRLAQVEQSKAAYEASKQSQTSTANEIKRLESEYKLALKNHEQALKEVPAMQAKAQAEYSQNVAESAKNIEKSFPKTSRINSAEFEVADFIDSSINKSGIGGSLESRQATKILNSIFPEGELLGASDVVARYKALEDAIQRAKPEVQQVLNGFKEHLGQRLPAILENQVAYTTIIPEVTKALDKGLSETLSQLAKSDANQTAMNTMAKANAKRFIKSEINSANILEKIQSGEFAQDLANKMLTVDDFLVDIPLADRARLKGTSLMKKSFEEAQAKHRFFVSEMSKTLDAQLASSELKAAKSAAGASAKLKKDLQSTLGLAEPVALPAEPAMPKYPEMPPLGPPPGNTQMPSKPNLLQDPTAPTPQVFNAQPEPILPPNQGISGGAGDMLEKPLLGSGRGMVNNPVAKLAGLKYLLGPAALPAEAGYLAAKGLTSPTAAGEAARLTFKQAGVQAIESWAQKYPTYHDGILEDPMDRRSLVKEIEVSWDIPIEQKALYQSKVNRGIPLENPL